MFSVRGQQLMRAAQAGRRLISTTSVENGMGASELSLVVKAGSRFEPAPGVAHLLQKFAFSDTQLRSGLRLQRESELLGGSLSTQLGKEHLVLTARFLREDLPYYVEALASTVSTPLYKQYVFNEEVVPLAQAEASAKRADPSFVALEGAYEVAFRRGLANPTLVTPESPLSLEKVVDFSQRAFSESKSLQLFGRNVDKADLEKFAGSDFAKIGSAGSGLATEKAEFFNGEFRVKHQGLEQAAVLAFPTTTKPCLEALQYVLGGNNVKWSKSFGLLNSLPVKLQVHNAKFSDSSFFYVVLKGPDAATIRAAVKTTADTIKQVAAGLDEQVAAKAINTAKFAQAEAEGTLRGFITPATDLSKVSAKSISAAAKSLIEGKRVLSVVGQTYALPYADELF